MSVVRALIVLLSLLGLVACDTAPERAPTRMPSYLGQCEIATCSGHGTCDFDEQDRPQCVCLTGYRGESCEACEPGYHRDGNDNCSPDRSCADQPEDFCSGHGTCSDLTGVVECKCDVGYEGPRCTLCQPTHGRNAFDECVLLTLPEAGTPETKACSREECDGHGGCDDSTGEIICVCDAGYTGDRCTGCASGYFRYGLACVPEDQCQVDTCGEHGSCRDDRGTIECTCDQGYRGAYCELCAAGYHAEQGLGCLPDTTCLPNTCNQLGACSLTDGVLSCACQTPATGDRCQACLPDYHPSPLGGACLVNEVCAPESCSGHGDCDDSTGVIRCDCEPGHHGPKCDRCDPGFELLDNGECVRDVQCSDPLIASGKLDFEGVSGFPTLPENCHSDVVITSPLVILVSKSVEGKVWGCARSSIFGMTSDHVYLEMTPNTVTELRFSGSVAQLGFDYTARSDMSLDLVADGTKIVRHLELKARAKGTLFFGFDPGITKLSFQLPSGAQPAEIAIDNLEFSPPVCE